MAPQRLHSSPCARYSRVDTRESTSRRDLPRLLVRIGLLLEALATPLILVRIVLEGTYLPTSWIGLGIFEIADLGLVPAGALLVLSSRLPPMRKMQRLRPSLTVGIAVAVVVAVAVTVVGANGLLVPLLARSLEWGRLGVGPPVAVSSMVEIKDITSVEFPPHSALEEGFYRGGLSPELIAIIRIPREQLTGFLGGPAFSRDSDSSTQQRALVDSDSTFASLRGWHPDSARQFISIEAPVRGGPGIVKLLLDLDSGSTITVYLYFSG